MFNIFGKKKKEEPTVQDIINTLISKHINKELVYYLPSSDFMVSRKTVLSGNIEYKIGVNHTIFGDNSYLLVQESEPGFECIRVSEQCKFILDNFSQIEACLDDINKQLSVKQHDKIREENCQKKCAQRLAELVFQTDC